MRRGFSTALVLSLFCALIGCDGGNIEQATSGPVAPEAAEHIYDPDGLLTQLDSILQNQIQNFYDTLGIDVQIVVMQEPAGDIVQTAQRIFAERSVGSRARTGGILILLSPADSQARIAVSRSLEASYTDAVVGPITKAQLAPYLSYAMAGMAVMDTLAFLRDHALRAVANKSLPLAAVYREIPENLRAIELASSGGGAQTTIPTVADNNDLKAPPSESSLPRYLPGETPLDSVAAFQRVLADNVGYAFLDLYTAGGQVIRDRYPAAPHEQTERFYALRDSAPLTVAIEGDYAVVSSDAPVLGFMPVLLHKQDGLWRVDEAEMFKNLFFGHDGNKYLRNSNNPYMFGLADWGKGTFFDVAALEVEGDLHDALAQASKGTTAAEKFRYAELLFRNGFAALPSFPHYEAAVALAPDNLTYRLALADRYIYAGLTTPAQPHITWVKEAARKEGSLARDRSSRHIRELNNRGYARYYGKNTTVSRAAAIFYWEMANAIRADDYTSYSLCRMYSRPGTVTSSPGEALPHCEFALNVYSAASDTEKTRVKIANLKKFIARTEETLGRS